MCECCGTCKYGSYDRMNGYVCVNDSSEYVADFVEYDHCCEEYTQKGTKNDDQSGCYRN